MFAFYQVLFGQKMHNSTPATGHFTDPLTFPKILYTLKKSRVQTSVKPGQIIQNFNGRFYKKEYQRYEVTEDLDMSIDHVMYVTEHMMNYLIGKEEELSVVTTVEGREQDFFNERDRLHMRDVRNLFLGGMKVGVICLAVAAVILAVLRTREEDWKRLYFRTYSIALSAWLVIGVLLGIAFRVDFTTCFTIFHKLFFTNDLWLFDPETDYMIRMLPEGFFLDMVIRISEVFVAVLLLIWIVLFWGKRNYKKEEKKDD